MAMRNYGPPPPGMKVIPPPAGLPPLGVHDPQFVRGLGPLPHPSLLDEYREPRFLGVDARRLPPHPALIEESLAAQHQEIQGLLADNQRFAATHVALKQELETAQHEFRRMAHFADTLQVENDAKMRDLYEKSSRLEAELRSVAAMKNEIHHVLADVKELSEVKAELSGRVQAMSADLARYNSDLQQIPALKAEIESMKHELQRARSAIDFEKKGYAENYEHGLAMENKLVVMARELEKLRSEIAKVDKRAHHASTAAIANSGAVYASYGNPEVGYAGHSHPGYGTASVQHNPESYPQYGVTPGTWGAYDMQRPQGQR